MCLNIVVEMKFPPGCVLSCTLCPYLQVNADSNSIPTGASRTTYHMGALQKVIVITTRNEAYRTDTKN